MPPETVGPPAVPVAEGIPILVREITQRLEEKSPLTVAVAGPACGGKSSRVVEPLVEGLNEGVSLVEVDRYYFGRQFMEDAAAQSRGLNWHHPDAVDLQLVAHHIDLLKRGISIDHPVYDFATGETPYYKEVHSRSVIVVDGMFSLHANLRAQIDFGVYLEVSLDEQLKRRVNQNTSRGGPIYEVTRYAETIALPMFKEHIAPTRESADLVLTN